MKSNNKTHLVLPKDFSLESLRDQNPFRVPDGYFDELPLIIAQRIEANPRKTNIRRIHPGILTAAASVILLLGLALVMRTSIFNDSTEIQLSAIPETHIVSHLDTAITYGELDEPMLMEAAVKASNQEATVASTKDNKVQSEATGILPTVSDDAIIEYLVLNQSPSATATDIAQNK